MDSAPHALLRRSATDSYATSAAGVLALSESPIYTIEALQAYLDHLNPGGLVAITRWLGNPPRDTVKLFATAIAALQADVGTRPGETDPGKRLALLHGWDTATLLVKNGHFTPHEIATLRSFAAERQFDVAWHPGMRGERGSLCQPHARKLRVWPHVNAEISPVEVTLWTSTSVWTKLTQGMPSTLGGWK